MTSVAVARVVALTALIALMGSRADSVAQGVAPVTPTIESINVEYERELSRIEKARLDRLGKLALSQPKDQASATFESYFRLAIAKNFYADADPIAVRVIASESPANGVVWLAHLVHIVGEAEKGSYEDSLKSLSAALRLKGQQPNAKAEDATLSVGTRASIIDAYYQRLLHGDQIEVARKAMKLIVDNTDVPAIKELAGRRLKQLDLVGKPAPMVNGVDLEGKPFRLEDSRGDVVLVVFWATWCLPNAQEMPRLDHLYRTYHAKGLKVVGVNLDGSPGGSGSASATPNVRRFLLDYNVTWPTLVNGPGPQDFASAFGVTEIPANVLIGRDGKVRHIDLIGKRLEKAVAESLARKP